ncbi:diguanylate cyclase (GGDEF) domain-containing protein [Andreprevotia lacus DSM 23236]|jgi:diguanylate cyclase (GGDEF)-like protein|uniref:Diguanylate cyclase (GGDEF) domain-containing protein n=1 Tax=Andreprevotia lacus DSM 23236 TaxID=1121001 RepID=A0A1W1WWS5_9NEIS|nr:GGDEF domain-containing protein [Andreprevotia lacus]SMC16169.1 diguanylate cyclase (GGDEF) domain-containing protein [Andreprevotia lacus DSM 23236]
MPELPELTSLRRDIELLLQEARLSALFQPIASLNDGEIYGYEGLIRGPSDGYLHSPINLFRSADAVGLLQSVDLACRKAIIAAFVAERLQGRLFLNVSPACLTAPDFRPGATLDMLRAVGLPPQRVVIELTETHSTHDYALLKDALLHYRNMGFQIAIDDLGEGFSTLRLWSELQPDFVKIDKYFVQGLASDVQKRQFVRSIQHIALNTATKVIAEGIETQPELDVVRRIGIGFGQGYHIARPQQHPVRFLALELSEPESPRGSDERHARSAGSLLVEVPTVAPTERSEAVCQLFTGSPQLYALPVVEGDRPVGLLKRNEVLEFFARPFTHELYGNRPCRGLMDASPLIVETSMSLQELSLLVSAAERRYLADGFIVTEHGRYLGMGTGHDLMRALTELQMRAARYANPLTLLPGNVPIQEEIDGLLADAEPFAVAYFDLDHFKPYNDVYGYARGDSLIQLTGSLLLEMADPQHDFVGHIGGDDFVVIFRTPGAEQRCRDMLEGFEHQKLEHFEAAHRLSGGYASPDRRGELQWHSLVTLSVGIVEVQPGRYLSHHEVAAAAAAAKRCAKRQSGSSVFVERRADAADIEPPQALLTVG